MHEYTIYSYLDIGFFKTKKNGLCLDNGNIKVYDEEMCKRAADELDMNYGGWFWSMVHPSGCHQGWDESVYYNTEETGARAHNAAQICKITGKEKNVLLHLFIMLYSIHTFRIKIKDIY